ncbi:SH3 domain binding glutamic acid-rich protein-like [Mortierella sp. GBA30]|nr:SH3 domain binding glutamic acid-rich protein-like [Mortierella sp. GBA30]
MTHTSNDISQVSIDAVGAVQDTAVLSLSSDDSGKSDSKSNPLPSAVTLLTAINTATTTSSTIAAVTGEHEQHKSHQTTAEPLAPKVPTILLPPVDIEGKSKNSNNDVENIDYIVEATPSKPGTTSSTSKSTSTEAKKPATGTKTATLTTTKKSLLSSSVGRATGTTAVSRAKTSSSLGRISSSSSVSSPSSLSSSSSSSTAKPRPAIPASLRGMTPTHASPANAGTTARTTATATAANRTLTPSAPATSLRKSPSTPSLSPRTTTVATSAGRRVASSSGVDTASSLRNSPSSSPSTTRSLSRASVTSSIATTSNSNATPARRPLTSSSVSAATRGAMAGSSTNRSIAAATASKSAGARRTPASSTNSSPTSTLRQSTGTSSLSRTTASRPTAAQAANPTPIRKTLASSSTSSSIASTRVPIATSTRPMTDATKVKVLSSQLSGLQEKHDQTLKLLQEQEERLKEELEELSSVPEHERKPIPSDTQDVLQEMEELRTQFQKAKEQHEKALEDIAAERAAELLQLKDAQEALLLAVTQERDTVAESLRTLKESGEMTKRERDEKIKLLESQLTTALEGHAKAVEQHAEALESLRAEVESAWTMRLECRIQELIEEHEQKLKAAQESIEFTGISKESEIMALKDSLSQRIKDLEDENEARVLELIAKHDSEVQEWRDRLSNQIDAHEETLSALRQEYSETVDKLRGDLAVSLDTNAQLMDKLESNESELQNVRAAKTQVEADLDRANATAQDQLALVRAEMEEIRKLLALKETETAELERRVQELSDDLENTASISAMLKNTKRYKVKPVHIYGSSVSGNLKTKRAQQSISHALEQLWIEYEFVDVSTSDEAKRHMRRKNGGQTELPQIFSGGEYRGIFDDFEYAIETHQLLQFLAFDRTRGFVPRHKTAYDPDQDEGQRSFTSSLLAQDGEDAEQGAGSPDVVVNGQRNRSTSAGMHAVSGNGDLATSMYLLSPGSNRFRSTSLNSNSSTRLGLGTKPGFVQTASQVWDGALKKDITHANHDLGLHQSTLTADDDELEELYEQGVVSEADLEAMLASVNA